MQDVCTDQEMVQLLERARANDPAALDTLYQLYMNKVYRYIWYRVGDQETAEDLAMDVFVRLVERVHTFRPPKQDQVAAFSAWLFRIAGNRVVDYHRRRALAGKHLEQVAKSNPMEDMESPEAQVARISSQVKLRKALRTLNKNQRDVLYLRFVADLTSAQTAAAMKKSERAIKALQHRALANLRRVLDTQSG